MSFQMPSEEEMMVEGPPDDDQLNAVPFQVVGNEGSEVIISPPVSDAERLDELWWAFAIKKKLQKLIDDSTTALGRLHSDLRDASLRLDQLLDEIDETSPKDEKDAAPTSKISKDYDPLMGISEAGLTPSLAEILENADILTVSDARKWHTENNGKWQSLSGIGKKKAEEIISVLELD